MAGRQVLSIRPIFMFFLWSLTTQVTPKLGSSSWNGPPEIGTAELIPDPSEITPGSEIGSGTFGKVLAGRCRHKDVCIKILHKVNFDQKTLDAFRKEVGTVR